MNILKQRILLYFLGLCGALLLLSLGLIYFNYSELPSPIILHFDDFKGVDLFGEPNELWGIWFTGTLMIGINIFLAEGFFYRERVLSYLLVGSNVLLALLVLVISSLVISVN